MKKPQIHRIIPHIVQGEYSKSLSDRVADLHAQVIESKLDRLELTTEQKIMVIDQIIGNLKLREVHNAVVR